MEGERKRESEARLLFFVVFGWATENVFTWPPDSTFSILTFSFNHF